MDFSSLKWRVPAIAGSALFVYGGLRLILGDALMRPHEWTDYQIQAILLVTVTVFAGHLAKTAQQKKAYLSCIGFAIAFCMGTWLSARQSLNRQIETTVIVQNSAEETNKKLAEKGAELIDAKTRLKYAEDRFEQESTGQKCLDRCQHWKRTADERRTFVKSIEAEIKELGPSKPVNAGAQYFGDIAEALGFKREAAISLDALLTPLLWYFLYELGSITSLGFALSHGPAKPDKKEDRPVEEDPSDDVAVQGYFNGGGGRTDKAPEKPRAPYPGQSGMPNPNPVLSREEAFADIAKRVTDGQTIPSDKILGWDWNRPKQTVSDWMSEWRRIGAIPQATRVGRCNATVAVSA